MLRTDWDKKICAEYLKRDEDGNVYCDRCPLSLPQITPGACRANHHWSKEREEWVPDGETVCSNP